MKKNNMKSPIIAAALVGSILFCLTGCSTFNPYTGKKQTNDTSKGALIGTGGGVIIGALLGGKMGAVIGAAAGGLTGGFVGHHFDRENALLRQRLIGTGVQVTQTTQGIQLTMASDVTFGFNRTRIKPSFYGPLDSIVLVLKQYKHNDIAITGYTDSVGNARYNQPLSEKRAQRLSAYLVAKGISPHRIFTKGYGDRYPVATNTTAQGRAKNRRVVMLLRATS